LTDVPTGFSVLYVDEALLVLDKPAGLLCVPGRGADKQDCLSARAQAMHPDALIVHRLDMATSGLVLMARGAGNQRRLSAAFEARTVAKTYVAVVAAAPDTVPVEWSTIDLPIGPDWPRRPRQKIDHAHGKPSVTRWRRAPGAAGLQNAWGRCTRVELEPVTGRTHQLRVHLAAIGHPILGDVLYASASIAESPARLMLHASSLSFLHPVTGIARQFNSPAAF
jgi:tRNA pseudouridine32 synthase / 23S rRNA pseudouridine746 synthase